MRLHHELISRLLKEGKEVYALYDTVFENPEHSPPIPEGVQAITWNPRSGVSTSAAVLSSVRKMQTIETIYLHIQCEDVPLPLHDVSWAVLRQVMDRQLLSLLFLLREYSSLLLKREGGVLVLSFRRQERSSPLLQMVEGAITALADALFVQFADSPIFFRAFRSEQNEKSFTDYMLKTLDEVGSRPVKRWYRHAEKMSFFRIS